MKTPRFWQAPKGTMASFALSPFGCLYGAITERRAHKPPIFQANVPVICIGNLTMGGAGKTPTAEAIARLLIQGNKQVSFLSRGYGGSQQGPVWVSNHSATEVGDEPLLLAKTAPVYVARDRIKGAKACAQQNTDVIIMDDGFQNPSLRKDLALIVIDGGYGHGNGQLFPAGPLRETLKSGLTRAHGIVFIGEDQTGLKPKIRNLRPDLPILHARINVVQSDLDRSKPVLAFAGIARPEKFYDSLQNEGFNLCETQSFADHHPFTRAEIEGLIKRAAQLNAQLITTQKDLVRIPTDLQKDIAVLKIRLAWQEEDVVKALLNSVFDQTDDASCR